MNIETAAPTAPTGIGPNEVGLRALFQTFFWLGLSGFGGSLPWARRLMVDKLRWLSALEFVDMLSLCQFLPGPNIVNVAIYTGARFRGALGAVVASVGVVLGPVAIVLALGALYTRFGQTDIVRGMFTGMSAAGSGLMIATGVQMALDSRLRPIMLLLGALTFVAVGVLRWSMVEVLLVMAPISVAIAWANRP